jgi:hypothetical protein
VRSIREDCLDRLILFEERRLRYAIAQFVAHYHGERNHQGLGNELIAPQCGQNGGTHLCCRERVGGLLRYYPSRGLGTDRIFGHYGTKPASGVAFRGPLSRRSI